MQSHDEKKKKENQTAALKEIETSSSERYKTYSGTALTERHQESLTFALSSLTFHILLQDKLCNKDIGVLIITQTVAF